MKKTALPLVAAVTAEPPLRKREDWTHIQPI